MIADQVKTAAQLLHKKLVSQRLVSGLRVRSPIDKFKFQRSNSVGFLDFEARDRSVNIVIPFGNHAFEAYYSYPANIGSIFGLIDEFLFELLVLKGNTVSEATTQLYDITDAEKKTLSQLDQYPDARREALEIKEGIRSLLDQIEQEHDLNRFQARAAFARIFGSGVPFPRKDGALVEEAMERVREHMTDDVVEELSGLEDPFNTVRHAPIRPRSARPRGQSENVNLQGLTTFLMAPEEMEEFQRWHTEQDGATVDAEDEQ